MNRDRNANGGTGHLGFLTATWRILLVVQAITLSTALTATITLDATGDRGSSQGEMTALVWLFATLLAGGWWRSETYKRGWVGHAITPTAYLVGNLPMLFGFTAGSLMLSSAIVTGTASSLALPATIASTILIALNRPHGAPLRPSTPRFVTVRP